MSNSICDKYTLCTTFEQMCHIGTKFANDECDVSLGWLDQQSKPNLYEMVGELEWIRPIIAQYNTFGFFTRLSQPGRESKCSPFKSHYHMMHCNGNINDDDLIQDDGHYYTIKQRAAIGDFMKIRQAQRL